MHPRADADIAIRAAGLGKCYQIYDRPQDRLKQFLFGRRRRYFREFWANRGIDLTLRRGETVGIVGRNGAGKTTLLQMLAGTLHPTMGELEVHGRVTSLLELGSGFNGEFTGRENVFLNGAVLGISRREMEERFESIVQFADIGEFLEQPVKTYSSGMFVRLAFAVLANLDPDIFIVDEALAVGDAYFRHRCMYRFKEMQDRGTAILFVSHDAITVKNLCDRVLWLEDGELRRDGDPDEVVDAYLQSLFRIQQREAKPQGEPVPAARWTPSEWVQAPLHFDKRLGDGRLVITAAALFDEAGAPLVRVRPGERLEMRLLVRDAGRPQPSGWIPGYVLRDFRGLEIASGNTHTDPAELGPLGEHQEACVRIFVRVPQLAPGSYSLSPTLAYEDGDGTPRLSDQLENALPFELISAKKVYCILALETEYRREASRDTAEGTTTA